MQQQLLHQSFLPDTNRGVQAYVWKFSLEHRGRRPRHFHREPELNLVVSGWAEFGIGESIVRVGKGELVGFPAGQDHALLATSPDVFLYAVGMAPQWAANVADSASGEASVPLRVRLAAAELAALERRAEQVVDRPGVDQMCAELWEQALWLGRRQPEAHGGRLHVLTKRALQSVTEAPGLGLEAIARRARTNASEVSRYFHRDLGMTFGRYRSRVRLLRFIELVQAGSSSWRTAAQAAGFGSYSQCHRVFQAELGCSPRSYFQAGRREEMQRAYEE